MIVPPTPESLPLILTMAPAHGPPPGKNLRKKRIKHLEQSAAHLGGQLTPI